MTLSAGETRYASLEFTVTWFLVAHINPELVDKAAGEKSIVGLRYHGTEACADMRIEDDVKLDFKDVLIRPKRSTLTTRSDVDISREFTFRHTGTKYAGIPIVASNMDTTGTFEMARALDAFKLSTALHKHYAVDEFVGVLRRARAQERGVLLDGDRRADEDKFEQVMQAGAARRARDPLRLHRRRQRLYRELRPVRRRRSASAIRIS